MQHYTHQQYLQNGQSKSYARRKEKSTERILIKVNEKRSVFKSTEMLFRLFIEGVSVKTIKCSVTSLMSLLRLFVCQR